MQQNPCKSAFRAVLFLGLLSGRTLSQDYFYSTDFEGREQSNFNPQPLPQPQQFRQRQPQQSGGGFSGGNGNTFFRQSSASASAGGNPGTGGGFVGIGAINASLQAQFAQIFDWNKDIGSDPMFRRCTVPDIGSVERACPKRAFYHGLNPQHRMAVGMVKHILTGKLR